MTVNDRLRVAKIILGILNDEGPQRWSNLEKETTRKSPTYAKFQATLQWLLKSRYIKRVKRGLYDITEKGRKLCDAI